MTATERPSDLLPCSSCGNDVNDDEGCYQSGGFGLASTPTWAVVCGNPSCNGETCATSRAEAIAAWNRRARTLDAAPADHVVSAECWRRAIEEWLANQLPDVADVKWERSAIENRARELAREGK